MSRFLKGDDTGRMEQVVLSHPGGTYLDPLEHVDPSRLDRERMAWWVDHLREAEANTRRPGVASRRCLLRLSGAVLSAMQP